MRYFPVEMKNNPRYCLVSLFLLFDSCVRRVGFGRFVLFAYRIVDVVDFRCVRTFSFFAILLAGFSLRGEIIRFGPTSATTIAVENIDHQLYSTEKSHTWALDVTDDAAGGIVHELDADLGDTTTGSYKVKCLLESALKQKVPSPRRCGNTAIVYIQAKGIEIRKIEIFTTYRYGRGHG